jgi:DtxR family Mn-dependent transcriptional regulator
MNLSFTEENYLKAIFKELEKGPARTTTNSIASAVATAPASVTDMLQKLSDKKLVNYERYQGVALTTQGKKMAVSVIRKHRLWELFLVSQLGFNWDEVHEIAEQLEHIQSDELVKRLYVFLGKPKWDPHGDPIPDELGNFHSQKAITLVSASKNDKLIVSGVIDHSSDFLKLLDNIGLMPGKKITVRDKTDYDHSMMIFIGASKNAVHISADIARNILVTYIKVSKHD